MNKIHDLKCSFDVFLTQNLISELINVYELYAMISRIFSGNIYLYIGMYNTKFHARVGIFDGFMAILNIKNRSYVHVCTYML